KRHGVIAEFAVRGGRIGFEAVAPAPEMLEAAPVPDNRIEGRQKSHRGWRVMSLRARSLRPEIGLALDFTLFQRAGFQQLPNGLARVGEARRTAAQERACRAQAVGRDGAKDPRHEQDEAARSFLRRGCDRTPARRLIDANSIAPPDDPEKTVIMQ